MNSKFLICFTAMTSFATLAIPARLHAQEQTGEEHHAKHHRYKIVVIGTFGGPQSGSFFGQARSLNNRGTLVGQADTSMPDQNYPNVNPLLSQDRFIPHGFRWQKGTLTDLGALPGVNGSNVSWVNDWGVPVGISTTGNLDPVTGFPAGNAVVWIGGHIFNLGTLDGGYESLALAPHDVVFHRHTPGRTMPAEGTRHRQSTHDDSN